MIRNSKVCLLFLVFCFMLHKGSSLWCYDCVSTQPGCGEQFNWMWHWTKICPEEDDVCVKIIERKNGDEVLTRTCLSFVQSFRKDIPADRYEGCRPGVIDVKLANYVNNSIKELDIYRDYYDETTWCFCFYDNWCNSSTASVPSFLLLTLSTIVYLYKFVF